MGEKVLEHGARCLWQLVRAIGGDGKPQLRRELARGSEQFAQVLDLRHAALTNFPAVMRLEA